MKASPSSSPHAWALDALDQHRAQMATGAALLHVPPLTGIMRHIPGMLLHAMPELFFQADGRNRIEFPGGHHVLRPGRACLVPRGLPHGETFHPARGKFRMLVLVFAADHIDFHICATARDGTTFPEQAGRVKTAESIRIASVLDDLARLGQKRNRRSADAVRDLWQGIIAWLGFVLDSPSVAPRYSSKVDRALLMIAQQLENPRLGVATLAAWIGCAPNYLSNLFHKETGVPLIQHIQRERTNKAQYLLAHSSMSVKEIAHACGLGTPAYLARLFHRFTGISPTEFRNSNPGGSTATN